MHLELKKLKFSKFAKENREDIEAWVDDDDEGFEDSSSDTSVISESSRIPRQGEYLGSPDDDTEDNEPEESSMDEEEWERGRLSLCREEHEMMEGIKAREVSYSSVQLAIINR